MAGMRQAYGLALRRRPRRSSRIGMGRPIPQGFRRSPPPKPPARAASGEVAESPMGAAYHHTRAQPAAAAGVVARAGAGACALAFPFSRT